MTNTKFRKKALLSSVAMMLVALVALGSATFAWFAVDPSVSTANSLKMTTSASTGIVILSESEKDLWTTKVNAAKADAMFDKSGVVLGAVVEKYDHDSDPETAAIEYDVDTDSDRTHIITNPSAVNITMPLIPKTGDVELSTSSNWYKAGGTDAEHGELPTTAGESPATDYSQLTAVALSKGTNCYKEKIYYKNTDTSAAAESITSATIDWTIDSATISNAVRVALLDSDGKLLGVWAPSGKTAKDFNGTSTIGDITTTAKGNAKTITAQEVSNDGSSYVEIVLYIDGEDTVTTSKNALDSAMANILTNLHVTLSI